MSSVRKINSARANGARSKGPVTPEGKARSARNATRHGLLADQIVLEGESRENFLIVVDQHIDRFQPVDGVEFALIEEMAAAFWRMRRNWTMETEFINDQQPEPSPDQSLNPATAAFLSHAAGAELALLHRYETRLNNMYRRAIRTFQMLRETRVPNEPNPDIGHWRTAPGNPQPEPDPSPGVNPQTLAAAGGDVPDAPAEPAQHTPAASTRSFCAAYQPEPLRVAVTRNHDWTNLSTGTGQKMDCRRIPSRTNPVASSAV